MDSAKFGVKLFFANQQDRPLAEFIPVFHAWIQRQALAGHLLIDVHDYSHVRHGPGIILVGHEALLSLDEAEGRRGLVYVRKQPAPLAAIVQAATAAAQLLTQEQGVQFQPGSFEVFNNDRLVTPTAAAVAAATGGQATRKPADPRERVTFVVTR
jgi:hypothetical protein